MITDRSLVLNPGELVDTGYVDVFRCRLACRERIAIGDLDRAYQKQLQLGDKQVFPPANGRWLADGSFEIFDGRHAWLSAIMLGHTHLLVAWIRKS